MAPKVTIVPKLQATLWQDAPGELAAMADLPETFRRLYYHLYTNSNASRAERITEDLALLLLLKLAVETNGGSDQLTHYLANGQDANEILLPILQKAFPGLVDERQRFSIGDEGLRWALEELSTVKLSTAPAHVVGEAFQALMGPRLRGDKGQFFTPRSLVRAMVNVIAPAPAESVLDPACGTGGFLVEAHLYQSRQSQESVPLGILIGIDKDHDLSRLAAALLQIISRGHARIGNFNSLDTEQWNTELDPNESLLFDVVLTNPPFGARIGVRDTTILKLYDLGYQWTQRLGSDTWQKTTALASSQDPQVLFLELCVRRLKPGGRLGIVLPEGVFGNKGQGYVWTWLRTQGHIFALLDCPRTTFQPGTDTKTNVLFFQKASDANPLEAEHRSSVKVAVALHCGHDRRGRARLSDGRPYPDDFADLGPQYHAAPTPDSIWREVQLSRPDYLVPRYYAQERPLTRQEAELTDGAVIMTIGELVESRLITVRKGHEVGSDVYGTGDIPFVRTSDVANFEISADPTKAISDDIYTSFVKQQGLKPGDVLVVVDGRYRIGATALLTQHNHRCVVQSHFRILSALKPDRLDAYELLLALNLPSVRLRIRDLVFIQSTLGTLGKRLLELRLPILHGDGPWTERLQAFRTALQQRDQLLAELQAMSGPDYEL